VLGCLTHERGEELQGVEGPSAVAPQSKWIEKVLSTHLAIIEPEQRSPL
jgi:hypothetical protein